MRTDFDLFVTLKRFDQPDETRTFPKGRFDLVKLGNMTLGRASYEPGWRWSEHVGRGTGQAFCEVEHVGLVLSGRATAAMRDGTVIELAPGDLFHIPPGHDSWVIGNDPYVSLHFLGSDRYARR
jgi:quercetin dioxygenase-like cupin family protein